MHAAPSPTSSQRTGLVWFTSLYHTSTKKIIMNKLVDSVSSLSPLSLTCLTPWIVSSLRYGRVLLYIQSKISTLIYCEWWPLLVRTQVAISHRLQPLLLILWKAYIKILICFGSPTHLLGELPIFIHQEELGEKIFCLTWNCPGTRVWESCN